MLRRSRPNRVNKGRRSREFARAYGSPERVAWIQQLPCVVCRETPCENAHVASGGMSRKADADKIVSLCSRCHGELHRVGLLSFQACYGIDLVAVAASTEEAWIRYG